MVLGAVIAFYPFYGGGKLVGLRFQAAAARYRGSASTSSRAQLGVLRRLLEDQIPD